MNATTEPRWGQRVVTLRCDAGHEIVIAAEWTRKGQRLAAGDYSGEECITCGGAS